MEQFDQVMAFGSDDAMQKKWKAFCRKIDTRTDNFNTVLRAIQDFLAEPYKATVLNSLKNRGVIDPQELSDYLVSKFKDIL